MKKFMVCLWGRMGSGKTYVAEKIKEALKEYDPHILATAKFLKEEFNSLVDPECKQRPTFVNGYTILRPWIGYYFDCMSAGNDVAKEKASLVKRMILQRYGTEIAVLNDNPEIWANKLAQLIHNDDNLNFIINDGCRFPFELRVFNNMGIKVFYAHFKVNDVIVDRTFNERYPNHSAYEKEMTINHSSELAVRGWHRLNDCGDFVEYEGRMTDYEIDELIKRIKTKYMEVFNA